MENEIKITKERILDAASTCKEAKKVLKNLFPDIFEDEKYFDLSELPKTIFSNEDAENAGFDNRYFFEVRHDGEYKFKAFYLDNPYNWEIIIDSEGATCLIPTKKL